MKLPRSCFLTLGLVAAAACEHARTRPPTDSAGAAASGRDSAASVNASGGSTMWDGGAGPLLLVAGESPADANVVLPDSANATTQIGSIPHPALVTLLSRSGTVQSAELPQLADTGSCLVATLSAAPPPRPWNVGFVGGVVSPLAVDSAGSLPPADSASLAASVTRLASALPNDSAGRFTGLSFVVNNLWRFTVPAGPQVVVAALARQINQEATPLQERTLLVAERTLPDTTLTLAYSDRSYGTEESVVNADVLAAVLIGAAHTPTIVVSRDYGDSMSFTFVQRMSSSTWRARWTSPRRRC